MTFFEKSQRFFRQYVPMIVVCMREGYTRHRLVQDLFAGVSVGIIALPLALAFAIASGVEPEQGLFTAIVSGFIISLLGGSRVQIAGPTGAFVIIIYAVVQKHGYEGLALATLIAGILMVLMGLARCGILLKFIPYPVTTGFTTGIALAIFTSQLKDFFGMRIDHLSPQFLEKCKDYCLFIHTWNPWAFGVACCTLVAIFVLRYYVPKFPGAIFAIACATLVTHFFHLPIESIQDKFGALPQALPTLHWPHFSLEQVRAVFPDAIAIALLGSIESLLSAVVADGITGHRHRSNCELVAQGLGNVGSVLFSGIPATGAIARTAANIRLGATTPVAGITHAITLLLLMLFFAPLASLIPLSALSAVLIFIAWNMSEVAHFKKIVLGERDDALVLLATFLLTVLIDLTAAVQIGVILSAMLFIKRLCDGNTVKACQILIADNLQEQPEARDGDILLKHHVPPGVVVFEIKGPFFYSVADQLEETLDRLEEIPEIFILRMRHVPIVDSTAMKALHQFAHKCQQKQIAFLISGVHDALAEAFKRAGLDTLVGKAHIFPHIDAALGYARKHLQMRQDEPVTSW